MIELHDAPCDTIRLVKSFTEFMSLNLEQVVNLQNYPLSSASLRIEFKQQLDRDGVLVLPEFLLTSAVESVRQEGLQRQDLAYYTQDDHNIYLNESDRAFPAQHPRNRRVSSSKGCITTDQIPEKSALRTLYDSAQFREFLCAVLGEPELHEYADSLSSINLHYASKGQELGWHFDNSSFAVTLLLQKPDAGGKFEYVKDVRCADRGEMNYALCEQVMDGDVGVEQLSMEEGALVLFRGRDSMHRVTPTQGGRTRMLVVLAYNTEPNVALSESARMTFFGRLG